jgi:hypothetical protein
VSLYCEDCGAAAIGRFDIEYRKVENGVETDETSKIVRGRALCAKHASTRPRATPSTAKSPSEVRVLPEVPEGALNPEPPAEAPSQ